MMILIANHLLTPANEREYAFIYNNIVISTMKASPFLEEMLHLVMLFLKKNGH